MEHPSNPNAIGIHVSREDFVTIRDKGGWYYDIPMHMVEYIAYNETTQSGTVNTPKTKFEFRQEDNPHFPWPWEREEFAPDDIDENGNPVVPVATDDDIARWMGV